MPTSHQLPDTIKTPGRVYIRTFGCQMNVYDSEKILAFLQDRYLPTASKEDADLIVLNTCSIRDKAEQKVYSLLGRLRSLKENNPDLLIGVGGCVAQQEGERILRRSPLVDLVFGTHNIHELTRIIDERISTGRRVCHVGEDRFKVTAAAAPKVVRTQGPTALLTIMKGCDNFCAYCIVPMVRGREISRGMSGIIDEARHLVDSGVREITLLGQNVNSYQDPETGSGFLELLEKLDSFDSLERLRFVTSHPKDFSKETAQAIAGLPSVCEHLHLPVQAGSDKVLKAMLRRYTTAEYLDKVSVLRELVPGVEITTDIIVGFPGEEREDFLQTISLLEEVRYQNVFSFRFSPRPGTAAAEMEDHVPQEEKRPWLPELQGVQNIITSQKHGSMVGKVVEVLVEGNGRREHASLEGRTRNNYIVHFQGSETLVGNLAEVRIFRSHGIHLEGKVL
ncbi:MAG: tRNA (N6-isopentenyl adenosine(37)-C2)-methylthiotransferase MiaB [Deltaproteobacteria bacterium]|nr:tRNA (N6-isopentenyl adenosine(37)-C2)-methylthiotransferase MiaB [Deltaproteobacteria bacterium]